MTHKQILEKIGARYLTEAIEEDINRLVSKAMSYLKNGSISDIQGYVLPKLLLRWNCVLLDNSHLKPSYVHTAWLVLAVLLHKNGLSDNPITENALKSIDYLNKNVILSDNFYNKSILIKELICTKPLSLKKKPPHIESITFYRAQDLISIQISNTYYVAFIHEITGINEAPVLEFFDFESNEIPRLEDLKSFNAKGKKYNDGNLRAIRFAVYGLKYLPDLASQINLLKACFEQRPATEHLQESIGLFVVSDLFELQENIRQMFI